MKRRDLLSHGVRAVGLTTVFGTGIASILGSGGGGGDDSNSPDNIAQDRVTGWTQMPLELYENTPPIDGNFNYDPLTTFDLTDSDFLASMGWPTFLPRPGDQGNQPSCTAWAVGYAAGTQTIRASGLNLTSAVSPADLFAKMRRRLAPNACTQGAHISWAMDVLVQEGVAMLEAAPYFESQCGAVANATTFHLDGFSRVNSGDLTSIRGSLQAMQPVSFGMLVNREFQALSTANNVFVPNGTGGGHAMTLVGYDDVRQRYKVINSWGTGWGDSGCFWISYSDFARYALDVCIPFLRRSSANQLLEGSNSAIASPIRMQHMNARGYGQGVPSSYGVGVEIGWSSPLAVDAATISVLDSTRNILFTRTFGVSQIARGLRFGSSLPDGSAVYRYVRATVTGRDSSNTRMTLSGLAEPPQR